MGNNFDGQEFMEFVSVANKRNQKILYPAYRNLDISLQNAKRESEVRAIYQANKIAAEANAKAAQAKQDEIAKQKEEELRKWNSLSNSERNTILENRRTDAENSKKMVCLNYKQTLSTYLRSPGPGVYMGDTYSSGVILLMKNRGCI